MLYGARGCKENAARRTYCFPDSLSHRRPTIAFISRRTTFYTQRLLYRLLAEEAEDEEKAVAVIAEFC